MSEQLPPLESHRRHAYVNVSGCWPTQVPLLAVSVCPTCGVPDTVGGAVFRGLAGAACTTAVAFEVALAEPSEFAAVTRTRSRCPTSACRTVYRLKVAPEIAVQPSPLPPLPLAGQRSHRYE